MMMLKKLACCTLFFCLLTTIGQAQTRNDRDQALQQLQDYRQAQLEQFARQAQLNPDQTEALKKWHFAQHEKKSTKQTPTAARPTATQQANDDEDLKKILTPQQIEQYEIWLKKLRPQLPPEPTEY